MKYPHGPNPAGMRQGQCMHSQGLIKGKNRPWLDTYPIPERAVLLTVWRQHAGPSLTTMVLDIFQVLFNHQESQPVCKKLPDVTGIVDVGQTNFNISMLHKPQSLVNHDILKWKEDAG